MPLGFPQTGHKGFGLGVIVDLLSGTLSGAGCSQKAPERSGNALFVVALRVEAFAVWEDFTAEVEGLIERLKSCPPMDGFEEVMLPGEHAHRQYLRRIRDGLAVDEAAWEQIGELAVELDVELPEPQSG